MYLYTHQTPFSCDWSYLLPHSLTWTTTTVSGVLSARSQRQESTWFVDGRPFSAQIRPIADQGIDSRRNPWGSPWEIHGKAPNSMLMSPMMAFFWGLSRRNSEWWGQSSCFQSAKSQHRRYKEWAQPFRGWESPNYLLYLRGLFATAKDIPYFLDQRFGVVDHPWWFFPHELFPINCVAQCYSLLIDWSSPCKSLRMFGYLTSRVCVYCIDIHWYTLWSSMF